MEAIKQAQALRAGIPKDLHLSPELVMGAAMALLRSPGCPTRLVQLELPKGLGALGHQPMVVQVVDLEAVYACSEAFAAKCQWEYLSAREN